MIILISESQKNILFDNIVGQRVMVYFNLHKKTFSIQKSGLVLLHADYVKLRNVEFRVRKGGKEKVRKEKSKNVHAFVIGDIVEYCEYPCSDIPTNVDGDVVTYNPYKYDSFVLKNTEEPIYSASEVDMVNGPNKIFIISE